MEKVIAAVIGKLVVLICQRNAVSILLKKKLMPGTSSISSLNCGSLARNLKTILSRYFHLKYKLHLDLDRDLDKIKE